MKLYHGTGESRIAEILKKGIKPRGKKSGNWKHTIESNPDAVYLTNAYAIYFAANATDLNKGERLAVLEIDTAKLDRYLLTPDEDYLEQATRKDGRDGLAPIDKPMKYRTRWYRRRILTDFSHHWMDSLDGLGTCTYSGDIPAGAITRIAFIEPKTYFEMVMVVGLDPTITLLNYRIVGEKYRNSIKLLFGDAGVDNSDPMLEYLSEEHRTQRLEAHKQVWSSGIEVQQCL